MSGKSTPVLLAGVMSGVALGLVCVTAALLWEGWSLRKQLLGTAVEAAQLRAQQAADRGALEVQQTELASLKAAVEKLRSEAGGTTAESGSPANARRARIYVGNRMMGLGWVLPSPTGVVDGETPGAGVASVMLDLPPADPNRSAAPAMQGFNPPPRDDDWSYYYYRSPSYWPYLYTSGWIEWPDCTNLTETANAMPFAPPTPPAQGTATAGASSSTVPIPASTTVSRAGVGPSQVRARYPQPAPVATFTRPGTVPMPRNPVLSRITPPAAAPAARTTYPSAAGVRGTISSPAPVRATAVGTRR